MFNRIDININIEFLLGLVSILLAFISIFIQMTKKKSKYFLVKEIFFEQFDIVPGHSEKVSGIMVGDSEVRTLKRVAIYLKNSGGKILSSRDFHMNPTLEIGEKSKIIALNLAQSNEYTKVQKKIMEGNMELIIHDFEPNSYIKIELTYGCTEKDNKETFKFYLKENKKTIIDLKNEFIEQKFSMSKNYNAVLPLSIGAGAVTFILTNLIVKFGLGISISNPDQFSWEWKVLYFTPAFLILVYAFRRIMRLINIWHSEGSSIDQWYSAY